MVFATPKKARFHALAGRSLAGYIRLVRRTSKVVYDPPDLTTHLVGAHPVIVAVWHGQFLLVPLLSQAGVPVRVMVARHGDAEAVAAMLTQFPDVDLIRGAGAGNRGRDRGGAQALRASVRALHDGASIVMTADVPPGPARRAGLGIITLARLSGRPIIPVAAASSRYKAFDTWSRLTANLPFSTVVFAAGAPIAVPSDADAVTEERARRHLEGELNRLTRHAYELAGADPGAATPHGVPGAAPHRLGLALRAYRGLSNVLPAFAPGLLAWRARHGKEDPARRGERMGRPSRARPDGALAWIHAASVGETIAVLPVVEALRNARPDVHVLLTTGTRTSARLVAERLGDRVIHQFVPFDAPSYVRRFYDFWQPAIGVFTESEIWPNLILEAQARGVPLALVNARLSGRSFSRWRKRLRVARPLFSAFDVVLAQNDKLARWLNQLGARDAQISGNLKIDAPPPPVDEAALERLEQVLSGRPVFLAASTHEGEDEIIAAAHRKLSREAEGVCTIIAPRHPERGLAIAEMLKARGLSVAQRSRGEMPGPGTEVYICDTIGELGTLYALAPVAFIGGSLVPHGGQNPIEAVRHACVVLTGPHVENFRDAYRALGRRGGVQEVDGAEAMAVAVAALLHDPAQRVAMQAAAESGLDGLSGALERTMTELLRLLPDVDGVSKDGLQRAS